MKAHLLTGIVTLGLATGAIFVGSSFVASNSAEAACVIGVRSNDVLNMRRRATSQSAIVGAIRPGRCGITIRRRSGNWALIRVAGRQGWVNLRYIGEGDEGDGDLSPVYACVVGVASNDVLNIRRRPSGGARIKGIIPPGRCNLRLLERRSRWSRVSYRGVSGWVSNRYIRQR